MILFPSCQQNKILQLLIEERDKLNAAIDALGGTAKRRGRPAGYKAKHMLETCQIGLKGPKKKKRKKRVFTAKRRKEQAARMKKYWAAKRKADKGTKGKAKATSKPKAAVAGSEPQS